MALSNSTRGLTTEGTEAQRGTNRKPQMRSAFERSVQRLTALFQGWSRRPQEGTHRVEAIPVASAVAPITLRAGLNGFRSRRPALGVCDSPSVTRCLSGKTLNLRELTTEPRRHGGCWEPEDGGQSLRAAHKHSPRWFLMEQEPTGRDWLNEGILLPRPLRLSVRLSILWFFVSFEVARTPGTHSNAERAL